MPYFRVKVIPKVTEWTYVINSEDPKSAKNEARKKYSKHQYEIEIDKAEGYKKRKKEEDYFDI